MIFIINGKLKWGFMSDIVCEKERRTATGDTETNPIGKYHRIKEICFGCKLEELEQKNKELESTKESMRQFCLDYQLWIKDYLLSIQKNNMEFFTFQDLRKQAYTHASKSKTPEWGDETYIDKEFKEIATLEQRLIKLEQAEKVLLTVFKGLEKGINTVPDSFPHGDMKFYFRNLSGVK